FDLRRAEGAHLGTTGVQVSNEVLLLMKRNVQEGAPAAGCYCRKIVLRVNVGNVERAMLAHPAILWLINTDLDADGGYGTKMGPQNHSVPIAESQQHVINPTNPSGALHDSVEDRLHVGGGAADDAEHLRRRRLVFEGLAQLCVALFELFKQTDVFDGDDGLVGEGFQQFDLLVRERPNFHPPNCDNTDRDAFPKQRDT